MSAPSTHPDPGSPAWSGMALIPRVSFHGASETDVHARVCVREHRQIACLPTPLPCGEQTLGTGAEFLHVHVNLCV